MVGLAVAVSSMVALLWLLPPAETMEEAAQIRLYERVGFFLLLAVGVIGLLWRGVAGY